MVGKRCPGVALLYHDIISHDKADNSGIVTEGSWRYKVPPETFRTHLDRIDTSPYRVTLVGDSSSKRPLLLTFDDGGVSCAETAAPILESFGLRGHFFVVTGRLGEEGYMTREQVQSLAAAGHHVGSHTVSHANLRKLPPEERRMELAESKQALENLLDTSCKSVSIPGGFVNERIVEEAFDVGYDYVFVSEPRYLSHRTSQKSVGRWNIWHDTGVDELGRILDRKLRTRLWIQGRWFSLKTIKRSIGQDRFERLRSPFVSRD